METGGVTSRGNRSLSRASTAMRSSSKKAGRLIGGGKGSRAIRAGGPPIGRLAFWEHAERSRFALAFRIERLGCKFAVGFFQQNFNAALCLFQLLLAFARKRHAFFEQLHGVVERELRALEAADDLFKASEGALEIGLLRQFRLFGCR